MAYEIWSQTNFSRGELSPYMYARADVAEYYNGLKTAQNVLTLPTGAASKRFGTLLQAQLSNSITSFNQIFFQTFQYLDECIYQLVFYPNNIDIYLEGNKVATVTSTGLNQQQVYNLDNTVIGTTFRVTGEGFHPKDLTRSSDMSGNVISSVSGSPAVWHLTSAVVAGLILPVQVQTSSVLPTTVPQILANVTYFALNLSTTTMALYPTAVDATNNTNAFTLVDNGSGTNTVFTLNTWTFANTFFKNLPFYDFNGSTTSYDALYFAVSAVTGSGVTVSITGGSYTPLNSSYIGGVFIGVGINGAFGTSRITAVASTTSFTVTVQDEFASTSPMLGSQILLAEPAWSDITNSGGRGWPEKCSSYQNRALFSNTAILGNGFWASVTNEYSNFGNLTNDDDDAISWFPSSDDVNVIRFIVPYRSITVHTNSGIYSSPLSDIAAITPSNFSLQLQDSTPADVLKPRAIDNQIIILSGNDCHTQLWDGINNAYTSSIVSVMNEQVINSPLDEDVYADLTKAGSRYVFIINANGSMAVFQTLLAEEVRGFTPQIMEQSYGNASFLQVASSSNGRAWFVVQREIASAGSPIAISAFAAHSLTATASNFSTTTPTAITFTTSGTLPASLPALAVQTYYWAIGLTANTFAVYLSQDDALAGLNAIMFTSAGTSSDVVPWPLATIFTLEELNQDVQLDCAVKYNGTPASTITVGPIFNAQSVKMVGDGFGFDAIGVNNQVVFEAHGTPQDVSLAYIGFPINLKIQPMPLAMANGAMIKNTTLTKPKHIRSVRFMFNNTIGGTINGYPIALEPFDMAHIGDPPIPSMGIFELMTQSGWDDFNTPLYTIEHDEPFQIQLLGVFMDVDI
jgi:hypothetical protein